MTDITPDKGTRVLLHSVWYSLQWQSEQHCGSSVAFSSIILFLFVCQNTQLKNKLPTWGQVVLTIPTGATFRIQVEVL